MKSKRANEDKPAIELIEEAFHLLRHAPPAAWGAYVTGTLPFILLLLYFWSDMARSAFAHERLLPGVLALSALFLWMKCCHAVFARHLVNRLCGQAPVRWNISELVRIAVHQAILQPAGLFLLPLSLILILPSCWAYAFFANATVFAANPELGPGGIIRRSWRQALLWPHQNHSLLFIIKFFVMFVFLNIMSALLGVPFLLKILFGIETVFTQSPWAALNSTVLAGAAALTFICVDPLLKATYVLRTFYGESLQTGQDLRAELRRFPTPTRAAALAVALLIVAAQSPMKAADLEAPSPAPATPRARIDADELNRSIDKIIQQREYSWRLPREVVEESGATTKGFFAALAEQLGRAGRAVGETIKDAWDWFRSLFRGASPPSTGGFSFTEAVRAIVILVLVALVGLVAWLLYKLWKRHQQSPLVEAIAAGAVPDLTDESVGADQLPQDGWMQLGHELLQRGELRLALRAFYLASLAHLAERELITLAKFKSNLDYQRELQRRGHALAGVPELFARHVAIFERSWYGPHAVTLDLLQEFTTATDRLRTGA